ncbi:MAG: hypothetical protein ACXAAO_11435, partial [Candidatus Thorarchaeota archaeon]
DIGPLSSCTKLKFLYLHHNQIQTIDLNPLSKCLDFRILRLGGNQLEEIDISGLVSPELRRLGLAMNRILRLDLTPLANADNLSSLDIAGNRLTKIDLAPLENCEELGELYLFSDHPDENEFASLNLSPLFNCAELEDFGVSGESELKADKNLQDEDDLPPAIVELIEEERITWV